MAQVVIQSEAKNLEGVHVDVIEILPPFGRLNDNYGTLKIIPQQTAWPVRQSSRHRQNS